METLPELDERVGVKKMQKNWIGKINGLYFNLTLNVW